VQAHRSNTIWNPARFWERNLGETEGMHPLEELIAVSRSRWKTKEQKRNKKPAKTTQNPPILLFCSFLAARSRTL